jgi:hypothetical protein
MEPSAMRHLAFAVTAFLCLGAPGLWAASPAAATAAPPAVAGEWRSLFDGHDLAGWDGDRRMWSVRDGVIHGETTADVKADGNTFLIREGLVLRDFELKLSFRCSTANNSGVQYRSRHITDPAAQPKNPWVVRGYQHELRNSAELPDVAGFIYDEGGKRGRICLIGERAEWADGAKRVTGQVIDAAGYARLFKVDDWNEVRILAEGRRLRHFMNGTLTLDFTDAEDMALREGVLALQLHAGVPMWAEFKDLAVRDRAPAE